MLHRLMSVWSRYGSDRRGFFLGTTLLITLILLIYTGGIQASLSSGPGGEFPTFRGSCFDIDLSQWFIVISEIFVKS